MIGKRPDRRVPRASGGDLLAVSGLALLRVGRATLLRGLDRRHDPGETGEHLTQLRGDRVLLAGEVVDLAPGALRGLLGLGTRLAELAVRLGAGLVDRLVGEVLGLVEGLGGGALGLDPARLGPLLDLLRAVLGGP